MEISDEVIKELFKAADLEVPKNISEADVLSALVNIKNAKIQKGKPQNKGNIQDQQTGSS